MSKIRRQFNYRKDYSNPFFRNKRKDNFSSSRFGKLKVYGGIILIFLIVWFFLFSSLFKINNIEIAGAQRSSSEELDNLAWNVAQGTKFYIFSRNNIFLFSKQDLIERLNDKYNFKNISVKKRLGKIILNISEKQPAAIWLEDNLYYMIDDNGKIIAESSAADVQSKQFFLIENRGGQKISNRIVGLDDKKIEYISKLNEEFKKISDFPIDRYIYDAEVDTVKAAIQGGPLAYFNTREEYLKQYSKLMVLFKEELKDDLFKQSYLDLRYGERVYYR